MNTTIKLNGLTATQSKKFTAAEAKLPENYSYGLHKDENGVYGVSVYLDEVDVGSAMKPDSDGWVQAHTSFPKEQVATGKIIQALLNRACVALWNRQPQWQFAA